MSKVQSPRSEGAVRHARENHSDVGRWTLDIGLRVTDLRKSFQSPAGERIDVLRGVSFSVAAGEAVAIMGPSGAGKSTLLHLLGGLEAPDHGNIVVGSFEVGGASIAALARFRGNQLGFIFQFHHLLPDLNAVENVAMPLVIKRTGRRAALNQAARSLESLALGPRITHAVTDLSGGEQQRVAVCRALITNPALVLADEPTGNLDASFVEEIGETLVSFAQKHRKMVVVATHNERLAQLCDRILILTSGKLCES